MADSKSSSPKSKPWKLTIAALILAVVLAIATIINVAWQGLNQRAPLTSYESPAEHFKYGSIGTESVNGIPFWIWVVLPRLFPEKLPGPGGYTSLGLTWEPGHELPVGFTKEIIGFPRVSLNCAACHVGTLRNTVTESPTLLLGAPSSTFNVQRYVQFLLDCAQDPRFNANFILPEITYNINLSLWDKLLYRFAIIPGTKKALLADSQNPTWVSDRPMFGPGRTDMNPLKIGVLNLPDDGSVGSTDIMAVWNEAAHDGFYKHSDGLTSDLHEAVLSSALGTGATLTTVHLESLERVETWMRETPPVPYPYPINTAVAAQGKPIFETSCATCHAVDGARTGTVIPLSEIATSPNRANHWTPDAAAAFNAFPSETEGRFPNVQDTDGYTAVSLDGIWARSPYLHNGSVPTLAALLSAPDNRPQTFYRGFDLYDTEHVGFISDGEAARKAGYRFDTNVVGNSNQGHLFGIDLNDDDKQALIEYLKTL
ncbi:MAG: cytochrome c [Cyanobacteria bacterium P01_A01_bin.37]